MVALIRELANIHFSTSATSSKPSTMAKLPFYMDMDINSNIIRGRSASSSKMNSRESSILSNASSSPYHEKMERNNNLPDEDVRDPVDSSQLSYEGNVEVGESVSTATDNHPQRGS